MSCSIHRLQPQLLLSKYNRVTDAMVKGKEDSRDECFMSTSESSEYSQAVQSLADRPPILEAFFK
jgi:hypothetical protein